MWQPCGLLEHAMTMTRLEQEPDARSHTLAELMGLAAAMESEAILRYGQLAAEMSRRGDHGLAAMFQVLLEEERAHLAGIERWSRATTGDSPPAARRPWQLPPEIARSWEEAVRSALLTPYRALSIAVLNEDRGFAFYTYVAARAEDTAARAAAARLAERAARPDAGRAADHSRCDRLRPSRVADRDGRGAKTCAPRRASRRVEAWRGCVGATRDRRRRATGGTDSRERCSGARERGGRRGAGARGEPRGLVAGEPRRKRTALRHLCRSCQPGRHRDRAARRPGWCQARRAPHRYTRRSPPRIGLVRSRAATAALRVAS